MLQLTIATLVLRGKFARTDVMEKAAAIVSDFLVEDMTLHRACELSDFGVTELLDFVWARGLRDVKSARWTVAKLVHSNQHYCQWEFPRAMRAAVRRGDFCMVQWVLTHFPGCPILSSVVDEAAGCGHSWVLQFLEADDTQRDIEWSISSLEKAAERGHWELVRWLDKRVSILEARRGGSEIVQFAFDQNNFEQLNWLIAKGFRLRSLRSSDCSKKSWGARSEIVRRLLEEEHDGAAEIVKYALDQAAKFGDIEFGKWLMMHYALINTDVEAAYMSALKTASANGHISMVKWLLSGSTNVGPAEAMHAAAKSGQLDVMRWLFKHYSLDSSAVLSRNDFGDDTAMDAAAKGGHLKVLQFLQRNTPVGGKRKLRDGEKDVQLCRRPRCTYRAMDGAAENGHLSVVKWLHENRLEGCTVRAMDAAAENGHLEVVQWLHMNRSEGCTSNAMDGAAANGDLKMLAWLNENTKAGCTKAALDSAAATGRLDIIKWLFSNSMYSEECTSSAMERAAAGGHLRVMKWLQANGLKGNPTAALNAAAGCIPSDLAKDRNLRVVQWLLPKSADIRLLPVIAQAIHAGQFEVALYLHSQRPIEYSDEEAKTMNTDLEYPNCQCIRDWIAKNFPPRWSQFMNFVANLKRFNSVSA